MTEHENCHVEPLEKPLDRQALDGAQVARLAVDGMGCPRCAMRVRNGLLGLDGVVLVEVLLEREFAAVAFDGARITPGALEQAVSDAGDDGRHRYQARVIDLVPAAQGLKF